MKIYLGKRRSSVQETDFTSLAVYECISEKSDGIECSGAPCDIIIEGCEIK